VIVSGAFSGRSRASAKKTANRSRSRPPIARGHQSQKLHIRWKGKIHVNGIRLAEFGSIHTFAISKHGKITQTVCCGWIGAKSHHGRKPKHIQTVRFPDDFEIKYHAAVCMQPQHGMPLAGVINIGNPALNLSIEGTVPNCIPGQSTGGRNILASNFVGQFQRRLSIFRSVWKENTFYEIGFPFPRSFKHWRA